MTRSTRFIAATALAGAAALGIGGIAAAQESDDGDLTVTEIEAPADPAASAVLAQTDPTTPPDDSATTDPAPADDGTADDGTTTDPPAAADDGTTDGLRGRGGCDDADTGSDDAGADSSTPAPAPADPVPAADPTTDPASEA